MRGLLSTLRVIVSPRGIRDGPNPSCQPPSDYQVRNCRDFGYVVFVLFSASRPFSTELTFRNQDIQEQRESPLVTIEPVLTTDFIVFPNIRFLQSSRYDLDKPAIEAQEPRYAFGVGTDKLGR